jgi:hypothetical protein
MLLRQSTRVPNTSKNNAFTSPATKGVIVDHAAFISPAAESGSCP